MFGMLMRLRFFGLYSEIEDYFIDFTFNQISGINQTH